MKPNLPIIRWKEIYDKYPKAWKMFYDWIITYDEICEFDIECLENQICSYIGGEFSKFSHFNRGDLYSFFDEINIVIRIHPRYYNATTIEYWEYMINDSEDFTSGFIDRKHAEQEAFLKAFEILNDSSDLK